MGTFNEELVTAGFAGQLPPELIDAEAQLRAQAAKYDGS